MAEILAEIADPNLTGKYLVRRDWVVVCAVGIRTGLRPQFPAIREINREFCDLGAFWKRHQERNARVPQRFTGQFPAKIKSEIIFGNREDC